MCGIFLAFNKKGLNHDEDFYEKFSQKLKHRGPDASKNFFSKNIYMGFNRLKIVDLSDEANMPMIDTDNKYVLVFNGQIYNYEKIRKELLSDCNFNTVSDSEIILEGYKKFGENFFEKLEGMWAIIIYDKIKDKLIISRDRLGIKQLYHCQIGDEIYFASEQKALIHLFKEKKIEIKLNFNYAINYLVSGNLDFKNETFYDQIFMIENSTQCEFDFKFKNFKKLYDIDIGIQKNFEKKSFTKIFLENIKKHSNSDVPISSTLSSGIDSSLIFFSLKNIYKKKLNSFTFNFSIFKDKEIETVKNVVKKYNFENVKIKIDEEKIKEKFDNFLDLMDEPFVSDNLFYQSILTKKVSKLNYKVLLVGDGADEFFFGYKKYFYLYLVYNLKSFKFIKTLKLIFQNQYGLSPIHLIKFIIKNLVNGFGERDVLVNQHGKKILNQNILKKINLNHYKISKKFKDILHKEIFIRFKFDILKFNKSNDITGMMNSVELRVPFIDEQLIKHSLNIKYDQHFENHNNKNILRLIAEEIIPKEFSEKKIKLHKPSSIELFVYKFLDKEIQNFFNHPISQKLFNENLKIIYLKDKKNYDKENAFIYFRYYQLIKLILLKELSVKI